MQHPDLHKLKDVKAFVLDVDGVLTDGSILVTENGEQLRSMNIKDGYALQLAVKKGYQIIVISGGSSEGVRIRLERLGIQEIHLSVQNKLAVFNAACARLSLSASQCLYVGDDIPDLEVMSKCGLKACPQDAVWQVKEQADLIAEFDGGKGCVREMIEKVMTFQGNWPL